MTPIEISSARKLLLGAVAFISLLVLAILPFSKLRVDFASFAPLFYLSGVLLLAAVYCNFRRMPRYTAALETVGCGLFMTIPILIGTYLAVAADFPLVDASFAHWDRALGFDWFSMILFVDTHRLLAEILLISYQTISFQLLLIPVILSVSRRPQRAYATIFGYGIICVIASLVSAVLPAIGAYPYYGIDQASLANINAHFALVSVADFNAVRDGGIANLALGHASGLLCFPSVHAGVAYLATWAAWDMKWLRMPVLLLNIVMCVSAISHGGHYLVDVIAGIGTAAFTTSVITALFYRNHRFSRIMMRPSISLQPAE